MASREIVHRDHERIVRMADGGIFEVLKHVFNSFEATEEDMWFSAAELETISGLCRKSVTRNLHSLEKRGMIEKKEYCVKGVPGRFVKYKLKGGDTIDFIKTYLY